ncbi:MAG: GNAT family N-acetyltransferase [bacterium]|nr:GNAT family N-acetyltransferase [bacterium]
MERFTQVYQESFAGPPYFETYSDLDIERDVWTPHLKSGCIVLALHAGEVVVGLGCAMPVTQWQHDKEFQAFLIDHKHCLPFCLDNVCFMTEVAVATNHRRQGIGTRLVQSRIEWACRNGMSHYMMRTAAEGSNSICMYRKLGAQELNGLVQNVSVHAKKVGSASKKRVYLYGSVG